MTDLIPAKQSAEQALAYAKSAREYIGYKVEIPNDAAYLSAGTFLQGVEKQIADIEAQRTSWTKPLNQVVKSINAFFKPARDEWELMSTDVRQAMVTYKLAQEQAKLAAQEQARQLQLTAPVTGVGEAAQQYQMLMGFVGAPPVKAAGIAEREVWEWSVVDASAIPREFLCVDEKKVAAYVAEHKGTTSIAGIAVQKSGGLTVRKA